MYTRILIATGGSPWSDAAAAYARIRTRVGAVLAEPTAAVAPYLAALLGVAATGADAEALRDLEPQALKSDARNRSVDTPWWHRLRQHEWFDKQFIRILMKPL